MGRVRMTHYGFGRTPQFTASTMIGLSPGLLRWRQRVETHSNGLDVPPLTLGGLEGALACLVFDVPWCGPQLRPLVS
jgi:hypothetical protein